MEREGIIRSASFQSLIRCPQFIFSHPHLSAHSSAIALRSSSQQGITRKYRPIAQTPVSFAMLAC